MKKAIPRIDKVGMAFLSVAWSLLINIHIK